VIGVGGFQFPILSRTSPSQRNFHFHFQTQDQLRSFTSG
jgi:hypothetical protein